MKRRLLLMFLLALGLAPGCEGGCGGCGSSEDQQPDAASEEGRVELLNPGKEPRVRLQVGRWQGLTYRWRMRNESSFGLQGNKPVRSPTVVALMTFRVTRGSADPVVRERNGKSFKLVEERATVDSLEVDPKGMSAETAKAMNQGLASYAGTRTRMLVAEDGETFEMKTELVGGVEPAPEEREVLDRTWEVQRRFPFRLPPEPVGVGGKWRFSETVELGGVKAIQMAEMSVKSITDRQAVIRISVRQHAPVQEFPHPFAPGKTALLEQFRGDGEGQLTIDRLTGIPVQGKLSVTGRLTVSTLGNQSERASFISASVLTSTATILGDGGGVDLDAGDDWGDGGASDGGADSADATPSSPTPVPSSSAPPVPSGDGDD
ncbi:MAG: hypothetical protein KC766_01295 [Myxococcales bacterium]|nr:hypothetical protein [Myxococcales bacterium]